MAEENQVEAPVVEGVPVAPYAGSTLNPANVGSVTGGPRVGSQLPQLSYGERAVGITFNPGGNPQVEDIKRKFADIIDMLHAMRNSDHVHVSPEKVRVISIAITNVQDAQMWAVKGITWQD